MSLAVLKQQLHPFEITMRWHGLMGWPAMTQREMRILKRIFLSFPEEKKIKIFEYGMGFSTVYFAKFLQKSGRMFELHSIDNNRFWYEKVATMIKAQKLTDKVILHLREFPPFWEKPGWDWNANCPREIFAPQTPAEKEYVNFPQSLKTSFDVIFVDARFRRRCLDAALRCLDPQGFVILHDAQKKHYQSATKLYHFSQFLNSGKYFPFARRKYQLWLGSPLNSLVDQIALEAA